MLYQEAAFLLSYISIIRMLEINHKPNTLIGSFMDSGVISVKLDKINSVGVVGTGVSINTIGDEDYTFMNYSSATRKELSDKIQEILDNKMEKAANESVTIAQQK
jgi:hypothetical protein